MSASKLLNQWGLVGALEAGYGTDATPAAADGILTLEAPRIAQEYAHDGSRAGSAPGGGGLKKVERSGRSGKLTVVSEFAGPGAAYSALAVPSIHKLLRMSGHGATVDTTEGSESYVYAPTSSFMSGTLKSYLAGQSQKLRGVYGSMSINADGAVVPSFSFELMGIADAIADEALPAITYPNASTNPPKSTSIALTLNAWATAVVRSWSLTQNLPLSPRLDDNSAGHAGFSPGRADPKMEVVVEAVPLATFNPYELADAATAFALSLQVGSLQYNRLKLAAATVQIDSVEDSEDGSTALWTLQLSLKPSGYALIDHYTLTAD